MYENQAQKTASKYASAGCDAVPQVEKRMASLDRGIGNLGERAVTLRTRLSDFRARASGSHPEKDEPKNPRPIASGMFGEAEQHLEDAAQYIEDCHALMSHLETII